MSDVLFPVGTAVWTGANHAATVVAVEGKWRKVQYDDTTDITTWVLVGSLNQRRSSDV